MSPVPSVLRGFKPPRPPSSWSAPASVGVAFGLVLAMTAGKAAAVWSTGIFVNPDDAMRAVEVRDLLHGQAWFDLVQHRLAPGHGGPMHWSRLADLPIAGLELLFGRLVGDDAAERLARIVEPMILLLGVLACMARLGRRLIGPQGPLAACLVAVGGGETVSAFLPGHIHHHGLQVLILMALAAATTESLGRDHGDVRAAAAAGGLSALTLAINLQNLPFVAIGGALYGLAWAVRGAPMARAFAAFALALAGGSAAVFLLQVPPPLWSVGACDAFGAPHLLAASVAGIGSVALTSLTPILGTPARRMVGASALVAVVLTALHLTYPACLGDPYAGVDPMLRSRWLDQVSEAMPLTTLLRRDPAGTAPIAAMLAAGAVSLALAVARSSGGMRWRWGAVAAFFLAGVAGTLWEVRVASSTEPFAALGIAATLIRLFGPARPRIPLKALLCIVTGLAMTQAGWAAALPGSAARDEPRTAPVGGGRRADVDAAACFAPSAYEGLAALPPGLVLSTIDPGSDILAYTPHAVLAAPYHRDAYGNLIALRFFEAASGPARRLAVAASVRYVAVCLTSPDVVADAQRQPDSVAALILNGTPPPWLRSTGADDAVMRVFEVVDDGRGEGP